jgi:alpha-amylase
VGVLLQAAYRRANGVSVPSPADGGRAVPWWWDHLADQAQEFRLSGFSAILLPPVIKTSAGAHAGADGYGPFDDYDLGSKDQCFSIPTRFGSREQLQRCVAIMRANGLDVYVDTVPHQRDGENDFVYRYLGANGTPNTGRFSKDKDFFFPNVPRDPIAGPVSTDFGFGDELCPVNAKPPGYVMHGLIDAGDWMTRALDVQGYRIDDVKGLAVEFVRRGLTSKAMVGKFAVGEYFDGNPSTLNWWVWQSGMMGRCNAFDFSLRFMLAAMCNNASRWDMSQLDHAGLAGISPANAVTFVDNPDTDLSSSAISNKMLAYAYILTSEGYPCVFYKDYSTDQGCYGLKPKIDNLAWIHENLAFGTTVWGIPPNNNGLGYVAYSRTGFGRPFAAVPHRVTQTFEGASDLDIGPAVEGKTVQVGRIWCAAGSQIDAVFVPNAVNWAAGTQLQLEILDPRGAPVASQPWTAGQPAPGPSRVSVG